METWDGIVVGAGHNGLTCAAYLAKAGLRVAVVEGNETIGGGTSTRELTLPGFRHNIHANYFIGFDASPVYRDLELERYGFRFLVPPVQQAYLFRDGQALVVHDDPDRTAASIERFSARDADTFRVLHDRWAVAMRPFFVSLLHTPPSPPEQLRERLPGAQGQELLDLAALTPYEAIDRYFEDEHVRVLLKKLLHIVHANDFPGTGMWFPLLVSNLNRMTMPVGGAVSLPQALQRVVEEHEGEVLTGSRVEHILVEDGAARGVALSGGNRLLASRFVVSAIDFPQTLRLAGMHRFDSDVQDKARSWRWTGDHSLMTLHLALNERPRYHAAEFDPDVNDAYNIQFGVDNTSELVRTFKEMRDGVFPTLPAGNGCCNTMFDPSYAPPGKHTAFWWPFASYELDGSASTWDRRREEFTERLLSVWRGYAPNLTQDNVLGSYLYTPLDVERGNASMVQGSVRLGAYSADQMGIHRPHRKLADYRTPPVEGLYHCGSSSASGGGVNGAPGYCAADVVVRDLGAQRWWPQLGPAAWEG